MEEKSTEVFAYYLNKMNNTNKYDSDKAEKEVSEYNKKELQTFYILVNCFYIYKIRGLEEPKFQHNPNSNLYIFTGGDLQIIYHKTTNLTEEMIIPGFKNVLFVQEKNFKESFQKIGDYNISYITRDQMIIPILNQQIINYTILDKFEIYEGIEIDYKCPLILYNDSLVIQLGLKVGQVLKIETIIPESNKLPQIEYTYRIVSYPQVKTKAVYDDEDKDNEIELLEGEILQPGDDFD